MRLPLTGSGPGAPMSNLLHEYEVRLRKDHRDVDLISDALPFGRLWYGEPNAVSNVVERDREARALRHFKEFV